MRRWAWAAACSASIAVAAACADVERPAGGFATSAPTPRASAEMPPAVQGDAEDGGSARPEPFVPTTAMERALEQAPFVALRRVSEDPAMFDAALAAKGAGVDALEAHVELAVARDPLAHRSKVAFYRLARELDLGDVVPVATVRAVTLRELGDLFAARPHELGPLAARASIRNDGTIAALVQAKPRPGRDTVVTSPRPEWMRWASSPVPQPDERRAELRGFVAMLVLDYLSGNVLRRTAIVGDHGLELVDNATAFPASPDPRALDRVLGPLRQVVRFPRGLERALTRFDPARAQAVLQSGGFGDWLVAPRTLVELDERRVALLSLVEARIAEHGAEVVSSL